MNDLKLPFYVRLSLSLLTVVLLFIILRAAAGIFIPLLFALLVAIMLLPLNNFFETRLRLGRSASPLLCVTLAIAVMGIFLYFVSTQLAIFLQDIPALQVRLTGLFDTIQLWLSSKMKVSAGQQTEYIGKTLERVMEMIGSSASNLLLYVSGTLLLLVFVFLFTFFILYYRRLLMRFLLALFGERNGAQVQEVVMGTRNMINAYIVGLVVEMVLVGVFSCALLLLMNVHYPFLLGIMVAIFNVIPYVGFYSAMVITMLVTFANSNMNMALQAGGVLFALHLVDANVLFPRIMGRRMRVNPFVTIVAVIIGQYLWGVPGMFLSVPVAGTVNLVCESVGRFKVWSILMGSDEG
ncbi:AI-2E family transporter [Nemorincola caseinilytica]|uniref:AI-2E family transporter n=1 Tax=Nemorincola caseinilytica TaxID=2054315 RepID=A0ABP8NB41_9BACT